MAFSLDRWAVVFDVDQTLAETSSLEGLRRARKWDACIRAAASLDLFDGIGEAMSALHERGGTLFVASSAAQRYVEAFVRRLYVPVHSVLHYYSVPFHLEPKLSRRASLKAAQLRHIAGLSDWKYLVHVGDDVDDALGAFTAGARFVHACWGSDCEALRGVHPGEPAQLLQGLMGLDAQ